MSGDREWAVRVVDTAPGVPERIVPVGNRFQAYRQVGRIEAQVVWRYRFMPEMPWETA